MRNESPEVPGRARDPVMAQPWLEAQHLAYAYPAGTVAVLGAGGRVRLPAVPLGSEERALTTLALVASMTGYSRFAAAIVLGSVDSGRDESWPKSG